MDTLVLAQFMGLFSIIFAFAMLVRRKMVVHILKDIYTHRALTFIIGTIEVAAGLLLILNHGVWDTALQAAVSLLGWLVLLEGVFYLFVPERALKSLAKVMKKTGLYYLLVILYLALGIYLVYAGFSA